MELCDPRSRFKGVALLSLSLAHNLSHFLPYTLHPHAPPQSPLPRSHIQASELKMLRVASSSFFDMVAVSVDTLMEFDNLE